MSDKKLAKIGKVDADTRSVIMDNNDISKIENLDHCPLIEHLSLANNRIVRLFGMAKLKNLRILNLQNNSIVSIEGLNELVNLRLLNLSGNCIEIAENLKHNTQLEVLDLSENNIAELDNLSYLLNLKTLFLHGNAIRSLKQAPSSLPKEIEALTLADNEIHDLNEISFLSSLPKLEQLSIMNNPCTGMIDKLSPFDYRPFVISWCMNLRSLDGADITEKESLKAEWLYSQGKGRHFRPGQHMELSDYLKRVCPNRPTEQTQSFDDAKLLKILSHQRQHQKVVTTSMTTSSTTLTEISSQQDDDAIILGMEFADVHRSVGNPSVAPYPPESPAIMKMSTGSSPPSSPILAWGGSNPNTPSKRESAVPEDEHTPEAEQELLSDSLLESETVYVPLEGGFGHNSPSKLQTVGSNLPHQVMLPERLENAAKSKSSSRTTPHSSYSANDSHGGDLSSQSMSKYEEYENRPIKPLNQQLFHAALESLPVPAPGTIEASPTGDANDSALVESPGVLNGILHVANERRSHRSRPRPSTANTSLQKSASSRSLAPKKEPSVNQTPTTPTTPTPVVNRVSKLKYQLSLPTTKSRPETLTVSKRPVVVEKPPTPKVEQNGVHGSHGSHGTHGAHVAHAAHPVHPAHPAHPAHPPHPAHPAHPVHPSHIPHPERKPHGKNGIAQNAAMTYTSPLKLTRELQRQRSTAGSKQPKEPKEPTRSPREVQAATTIQKHWRGYLVRNKDEQVKMMKLKLNNDRITRLIEFLLGEFSRMSNLYQRERQLRKMQVDAIKQLWKELEELKAWKQTVEEQRGMFRDSVNRVEFQSLDNDTDKFTRSDQYSPHSQAGSVPRSESPYEKPRTPGVPTPPRGLRLFPRGEDRVVLKWKPAKVYDGNGKESADSLLGYRVYVNGEASGQVSGSQTQALVTNLDPNETYNISVRAVSTNGESDDSNTVVAQLSIIQSESFDDSDLRRDSTFETPTPRSKTTSSLIEEQRDTTEKEAPLNRNNNNGGPEAGMEPPQPLTSSRNCVLNSILSQRRAEEERKASESVPDFPQKAVPVSPRRPLSRDVNSLLQNIRHQLEMRRSKMREMQLEDAKQPSAPSMYSHLELVSTDSEPAISSQDSLSSADSLMVSRQRMAALGDKFRVATGAKNPKESNYFPSFSVKASSTPTKTSSGSSSQGPSSGSPNKDSHRPTGTASQASSALGSFTDTISSLKLSETPSEGTLMDIAPDIVDGLAASSSEEPLVM